MSRLIDKQPTIEPETDCISRQAAIDSFKADDDGSQWSMDDIVYRLEQFPSAQPETHEERTETHACDLVSRQEVIDLCKSKDPEYKLYHLIEDVECLPSAQPERDIPVKPIEVIERTWGIESLQAVCPKCDHYLTKVCFIGDGKHITYCEICGQAIDWKGWDFDG